MDWKKLISAIILCQGAGLIGSFFTAPNIASWYRFLNKPSFSPPNWLFAPAWLTLYTLMAVSFTLIWQQAAKNKAAQKAIVFFLIHLLFNAIWSILFFGLRNPLLGLIDIVLLWFMIVGLIIYFWKIKKLASILLIPYLAWVSFATILNYSVWQLN